MSQHQPTLLWHDYETWGADPSRDHPAQFAAIRTDMDLNPIGEPIELFCQLPGDYLPAPEAMFVTGITPQRANRLGDVEAEFMRKVNDQMSIAGTCTVGYNSIRFDDEVTRYSLYRNFFDPYAREWQNGNSRWDIIDLVRACYALRPEGIEWPLRDDGKPSFKLEHLTAANGLDHGKAHDAVSDVEATIALAKLIKEKQPKLFNWYFSLRRKQAVSKLVDVLALKPLLHVSSRFSAEHGCASLVAPMAWHPENKNAVVVVDMHQDISPLIEWDAERLKQRLYTPSKNLEPGEPRVPIKLLHFNKSPFIAPAATLEDEQAKRLGIDKQRCRDNFKLLRQHQQQIREKLTAIYTEQRDGADDRDVDQQLYGGFFSDADRSQMELVRSTAPQNLAALEPQFHDPRLPTLFFRYRARNFPNTLSEVELARWQQHCNERINNPDYVMHLEQLAEQNQQDEQRMSLLKALYNYLQSL
ncbi:exodeoxyribonuclease I [Ferrimonas aestuarii]|uniref:Exodeoxyribonuclease I n=1 Tax=Ferrimonas aestuarii TaxID=2569539 RepID=A0A4V5NWM2_9GAMM|nr:exodeoxyribonuclease I [Ferrimonas aestuarii]TKB58488.1 exodeoxyribonuclease I [Ferrimonas aestuarii]